MENSPEAAFCYDANYLYYEILPRLIGALAGLYHTAGAFFIRLLDNTHYKQGGRRQLSEVIAEIACTLKWHATGENANWYVWVVQAGPETGG